MARELISIREFARRMDVTDKAIRDGIKAGKIKKGITYDKDSKPQIIYEVAQVEFLNNGMGKRSKGFQEQLAKSEQKESTPVAPPDNSGLLSYEMALRKKVNQEAAIKELEYQEKLGSLVNKKDVYNALFEFGQIVRQEIEIIPDRIIDSLLAAKSRNEAYNIMKEELYKALIILSSTDELKIEKR